jgi:hypothetical protein
MEPATGQLARDGAARESATDDDDVGAARGYCSRPSQ